MQTEAQSSSHPSLSPSDPTSTPSPTPHPASAFSEVFLGQLRRIAALALDRGCASAAAQPATQPEAAFAGPFAVEAVERAHEGPGHTLLRPGESPEGAATADGPAAVLERREEALRLAAVLPALAETPQHRLGEARRPSGSPSTTGAASSATSPPPPAGSPASAGIPSRPTSTWPATSPLTPTPSPCSSSPSAPRRCLSSAGRSRGGWRR